MPLPAILMAAAPFIPKILDIAGKAAPILSGAAKSRGEAQATNEQLGINRALADINRRKYMLDAPGARMRQAARSSMVASHTPTEFKMLKPGAGQRGEAPQFSGGFNNPNLYTDDTKKLANETIKNHLVASLSGEDRIPELPPVGRSSRIDKILGGAGLVTGMLGAFARPKAQGPVYRPHDPNDHD